MLNVQHFGNTAKVYSVSEDAKKIFISVYLNRYRFIGLLDGGSDLTLMHMSVYKKIFKKDLNDSQVSAVSSYSAHDVSIKGEIKCFVKLSPHHPGFEITIYVVPDNKESPALLLGNDFLKKGMGHISYIGDVRSPTPKVVFNHPIEYECKVHYTTPMDQYSCYAEMILEPQEMTQVDFYLSSAATIIRTDIVLITACHSDIVNIIPSRSNVSFNKEKDCYMAEGCVINIGTERKMFAIGGKFEIVSAEVNYPVVMAAKRSVSVGTDLLTVLETQGLEVPSDEGVSRDEESPPGTPPPMWSNNDIPIYNVPYSTITILPTEWITLDGAEAMVQYDCEATVSTVTTRWEEGLDEPIEASGMVPGLSGDEAVVHCAYDIPFTTASGLLQVRRLLGIDYCGINRHEPPKEAYLEAFGPLGKGTFADQGQWEIHIILGMDNADLFPRHIALRGGLGLVCSSLTGKYILKGKWDEKPSPSH
jgi:hypothetical protein